MPNAAPRSWRILLPLAGVVLLALLWTIYWFVAAGIAKDRLAEERAKLAKQGVTLACTHEEWGGYPFHFELTCTSPVLKLDNLAEIGSGKLLLAALAYAPGQVVALLDGPSSVSTQGILATTAEHQRIIAAVTFDRNSQPKLSAEIPSPSVPGQGEAAELMLHTRPSATGGTDVAISARKVNYRPEGRAPLAIAQGELLASVSAEGTLNVERVALEQGTVRYWGSGTISLDAAHRPSGKLDTQTNDLDGLLKLLEPHLQITDEQKSGLRSMLSLLGSEAKAPLIAKDGVLYLGPFRIADLPPLY